MVKYNPKEVLSNIPHLMLEWDQSLNPGLDPSQIGYRSQIKINWRCTVKPNHIWSASMNRRTNSKTGCRFCGGFEADDENNLLVKFPEIAKEWDWELNDLKPEDYTPFSRKKVNWICSINKEHKWKQTISIRTSCKGGCPFCCNRRANHTNCLATTHPELAKEFHPTKNGKKTVFNIPASHGYKVWWICEKGHEFFSKPYNRAIIGHDCPVCNRKVNHPDNSLAATHPEFLQYWDYEKNEVLPTEIMAGAQQKTHWKCEKNHQWAAITRNTVLNKNWCPVCNESKGERKIRLFLKREGFKYKRQFSFKEKDMAKLRYDYAVWIKDKLHLIEFHGEQHWIEWGSSSLTEKERQDKLIGTQTRDAKKAKYCEDNNIPLLVIPFWQMDNVELILEAWLN